MRKVVVAYSGGVDSTFLLKMACDALGRENVLAVIAKSETYPERELKSAKRLAREIGAPYRVISTKEINIKGYSRNPVNRCYFCKRELMGRLKKIAEEKSFFHVIDGSNYDDRHDVRYGEKALKNLGIKSPLAAAHIGKDEIRRLSMRLGLMTHDKPSFACLASRIPHGSRITKKRLLRIDRAEEYLRGLGFRQVRVRDYGDMARIEVEKVEIKKFLKQDLDKISRRFRNLGYKHTSIDLSGYRTGSMNT